MAILSRPVGNSLSAARWASWRLLDLLLTLSQMVLRKPSSRRWAALAATSTTGQHLRAEVMLTTSSLSAMYVWPPVSLDSFAVLTAALGNVHCRQDFTNSVWQMETQEEDGSWRVTSMYRRYPRHSP